MSNIDQVYLHLFSTPEGEKVLKNLEKVFQEKQGMFEHHEYAYFSGQRSVLSHIHQQIEKGKRER